MDRELMRRLHETIANHAGEVAELFSVPMKVTIFARNPAKPDGSTDSDVSDDGDTEALIAAIRKCRATGVHVGGPEFPRPAPAAPSSNRTFQGVQSAAPLWSFVIVHDIGDDDPWELAEGGEPDARVRLQAWDWIPLDERFDKDQPLPGLPGFYVWEGDVQAIHADGPDADSGSPGWAQFDGEWRRAKDSEVLAWLEWCRKVAP